MRRLDKKSGTTLGSMIGFSAGPERRGYYLHAQWEITRNGIRSFILSDGVKQMVETATRFSVKRLKQVEVSPGLIEELKAKTKGRLCPSLSSKKW